jgi:hypothetical protein
MGRHPRGGGYFGCGRHALLENIREAGFVMNFFALIYFEAIPYPKLGKNYLARESFLRDNAGLHSFAQGCRGSRATGVRSPFFTRNSVPLHLILSDSNPTSHTKEVMASRTGRSQSLLIIA